MLRGAIAIFRRDIKKFLSNPLVMFMTLVMPIMYLIVFGNAIGGTITGIPLGVVQEFLDVPAEDGDRSPEHQEEPPGGVKGPFIPEPSSFFPVR